MMHNIDIYNPILIGTCECSEVNLRIDRFSIRAFKTVYNNRFEFELEALKLCLDRICVNTIKPRLNMFSMSITSNVARVKEGI